MMPEQKLIGQRMRERLLASGWVSSVDIEHQEKSFTLILSPTSPYTIAPRLMRLCVNVVGELKPPAHQHTMFPWWAAFAECPDDRTCRIWVACDVYYGYTGFDVLTELLLLGLKLSCALPSPAGQHVYSLDTLVRVYREKEELLTFYEQWVAQVIHDGDDLPTDECEPSLRVRWICCPKHRFLFVQRVLITDWLHHLFDVRDDDEEDGDVPTWETLTHTPSLEEMMQHLSRLLARTFSPQQWLHARCAYEVLEERGRWRLPVRHMCQHKHHIRFFCCQFHTALMAMWYLFSAWLEHYNDRYHMRCMVDEQGYAPGLFSGYGTALLIHLASLEAHDLPRSQWLERISSADVSTFHFQADHDHTIPK